MGETQLLPILYLQVDFAELYCVRPLGKLLFGFGFLEPPVGFRIGNLLIRSQLPADKNAPDSAQKVLDGNVS